MTSDSITEQAARAIEDVMALDRRALHDPSAAFGKSFFVRRGDVLAILSALAHQAPATEDEAAVVLADVQARQRALDNTPCQTCGGDRLRPDYRTPGPPCHATSDAVSP